MAIRNKRALKYLRSSEEQREHRMEIKRQDEEEEDEDEEDEDEEDEDEDEEEEDQLAKGKGKGTGGAPPPNPAIAGLPPGPPAPPPPSPPSPSPSTIPSDTSGAPSPPPSTTPTSTSIILSTSVAVDSTTSIQTSFITVTQSTVQKKETILTTTTSIDSFPVLTDSTPSLVTLSSSVSSKAAASPTVESLSPPGESVDPKQDGPMDPNISPLARNLLIALGVMGVISLLITTVIILVGRSKRRTLNKSDARPTPKDDPFHGPDEKLHGVTTEIKAMPRGESFQTVKGRPAAKTETRTIIGLHELAAKGSSPEEKKLSVSLQNGGRNFSDAVHSFMEKAKHSSYSYKLGP